MNKLLVGKPLKRVEDQRLLSGKGRYVDDIRRYGETFAVFVRSPIAHGDIASIDTSAALAAPGVLGVYTGADILRDGWKSIPCGWKVIDRNGEAHKAVPHYALTPDRARYVGDHLAVVVAETLAQARDAAELVEIVFDELAPVVDLATATDGEQIHALAPRNLCYDWVLGDEADIDRVFAQAHHVASLDLVNNRLVPNPMEPRAAIAEYDSAMGSYTLWSTSQNPHMLRWMLSDSVTGIPETKIRVIAPDVGGGFGMKIYCYPEETTCLWLAKKVGRPVRWTADRSESFLADTHGRDHLTTVQIALNTEGLFLGLKVDTTANMGAYLSNYATSIPTYFYATLLSGCYKIPKIYCNVRAVFTNTSPVDAYRGAGRPEAAYLIERIVEVAAQEMNIDAVEIRRRNFIKPGDFPYETPVHLTYDIGDYDASLDEALRMIDYDGFGARRADSLARGKLRGIGLACYIEACGVAPSQLIGKMGAGAGLWESAQIRFNATGTAFVLTGTHGHGQGHETTFGQIVADMLGIPIEDVEVVHGDTSQVPMGMGTYGSRSLAVGGSAIVRAGEKVIAKGRKIAAHMLEAPEGDVVFEHGYYMVEGSNKRVSIKEVAKRAYVPLDYPADLEPGLDETAFYDPANFTYPAGTHICEVEIDPDTGVLEIVDWVAVDDFGTVINPMIVEGQIHGGLAQGIGQAIMENGVYDSESGQLLTGSFMDYCMPRADDLPNFRVGYTVTRCTHNPLGAKGAGEAGSIAAPPTLMNAIVNALGIRHIDMPATREKIWRVARGRTANETEGKQA
ncbi:xanthine dehydrogenase family protein molybdopterin-binding subunit [Aminobacter sp. Piv2-1]|uniref:xanthine dehydrogenase family protein molybdopterin-binding subunit n=1 Tax=Aminobacter sp. Piv2-1 TaxID=3031122 RepID=UPI0030A8B580